MWWSQILILYLFGLSMPKGFLKYDSQHIFRKLVDSISHVSFGGEILSEKRKKNMSNFVRIHGSWKLIFDLTDAFFIFAISAKRGKSATSIIGVGKKNHNKRKR